MSKNNQEQNWIYVDPPTVLVGRIVTVCLGIGTAFIAACTFIFLEFLIILIPLLLFWAFMFGVGNPDNPGTLGKCIIEEDTVSFIHMKKTITELPVSSIRVIKVLYLGRPAPPRGALMEYPYMFLCSGDHKTEELKELMKIPADVIRLAYTEETVAFVKKYFPDVPFEDEEGIIAKQEEKIQKQKQKQEQKRKYK